MDIKSLIVSDEGLKLIDEGTWVGDFKTAPGLRLKVRGLRSINASKALERKQSEARIRNKGESLTEDQLGQIMQETLAEEVLLDWEGLTDSGKPLKYDAKLAYQWITTRNGDMFAKLVLEAAQKVDRQSHDFVEKAVKN